MTAREVLHEFRLREHRARQTVAKSLAEPEETPRASQHRQNSILYMEGYSAAMREAIALLARCEEVT
jgi:hypothetical protein